MVLLFRAKRFSFRYWCLVQCMATFSTHMNFDKRINGKEFTFFETISSIWSLKGDLECRFPAAKFHQILLSQGPRQENVDKLGKGLWAAGQYVLDPMWQGPHPFPCSREAVQWDFVCCSPCLPSRQIGEVALSCEPSAQSENPKKLDSPNKSEIVAWSQLWFFFQ